MSVTSYVPSMSGDFLGSGGTLSIHLAVKINVLNIETYNNSSITVIIGSSQ